MSFIDNFQKDCKKQDAVSVSFVCIWHMLCVTSRLLFAGFVGGVLMCVIFALLMSSCLPAWCAESMCGIVVGLLFTVLVVEVLLCVTLFACLFVCLSFFSKHTVGPVLLDFHLQSLVGNSCVQMLYYLFDFYRFSLFAFAFCLNQYNDGWMRMYIKVFQANGDSSVVALKSFRKKIVQHNIQEKSSTALILMFASEVRYLELYDLFFFVCIAYNVTLGTLSY